MPRLTLHVLGHGLPVTSVEVLGPEIVILVADTYVCIIIVITIFITIIIILLLYYYYTIIILLLYYYYYYYYYKYMYIHMCVLYHCEYMYSIYIYVYVYIHGIYNNLIPWWLSTHQSTIIAVVSKKKSLVDHHL